MLFNSLNECDSVWWAVVADKALWKNRMPWEKESAKRGVQGVV
jgi:hypothetical protein